MLPWSEPPHQDHHAHTTPNTTVPLDSAKIAHQCTELLPIAVPASKTLALQEDNTTPSMENARTAQTSLTPLQAARRALPTNAVQIKSEPQMEDAKLAQTTSEFRTENAQQCNAHRQEATKLSKEMAPSLLAQHITDQWLIARHATHQFAAPASL
jgi:hypothetical protein